MSFNSPVKSLYKAKKLYDYIFIIIVVIAVCLVIIQLTNGNLKSNNTRKESQENTIKCKQSEEDGVDALDHSELKTISEITLIQDSEEVFQTSFRKNDIPPINNPQFSGISEMESCIDGTEIVLVLEGENVTKIYPERILQHHLLINDEIEGNPILVSYCALCRTFQIYERTYQNTILEFGTTGLLYKNNDLIYDTLTESLWPQYAGETIAGSYIGAKLNSLSYSLSTFAEATAKYPNALILSFDTGFIRNYSDNSYQQFALTDEIIAPRTNINNKLQPKDITIGLIIDQKPYAIAVKNITASSAFTIEGNDYEIKKEGNSYSVITDGIKQNFHFGYWYVWSDFYPDTDLLQGK